MTTLTELKRLANKAPTCYADYEDFIAAANPATIKKMIAVMRLQHKALKRHQELTRPIDTTTEALAAFEGLEK